MSTSRSFGSGGSGTGLLHPPLDEAQRRRKRRRESAGGPPKPPGEGDDGGGGGRGGDGDGDEELGRPGDALAFGAGELGLGIVLLAVSTFFAVFVAVYFLMRRNSGAWPPPGFPGVPDGLWASTALLAASSAALLRASRSARSDRLDPQRAAPRITRLWVAAAMAFGVAFVGAQAWIWRELVKVGTSIESDAYWMAFYSLTALHVAHVLGGLFFFARVLVLSYGPPVTSYGRPRSWQKSLQLGSIYWHFMGGVWLVLFAVLYSSA